MGGKTHLMRDLNRDLCDGMMGYDCIHYSVLAQLYFSGESPQHDFQISCSYAGLAVRPRTDMHPKWLRRVPHKSKA